jgi:hypothetical protein
VCQKLYDSGKISKLAQWKSDVFDKGQLVRIGYDLALTMNPDWLVIIDSDEFLESGTSNRTLKDAVKQANNEGYNLVQFDRFDFFMTDADDAGNADSVRKRLTYYSYHGDFVYRCWKFVPGVNIEAGIHYPVFPDGTKYLISPTKFVLRHYPYRSSEQTKRKLQERISRTEDLFAAGIKQGIQYRRALRYEQPYLVAHKILTRYGEDNNWDYEMRFIPYANKNTPRRADLFTNDGQLRHKHLTFFGLRIENAKLKRGLRRLKQNPAQGMSNRKESTDGSDFS